MSTSSAVWGASFWRFIHLFSLHDANRGFMKQLRDLIPCEECRGGWRDPSDIEDLDEWSRIIHNEVNAKLGKYAGWDQADFNIAQKPTCDICDGREHVFMFPWMFIHTLAETSTDPHTTLAFLKQFNAAYPCNVCRGTFFADDPREGESIQQWANRHHNRWNLEQNRPPYIPSTRNANFADRQADGVSGPKSCCCGAEQ